MNEYLKHVCLNQCPIILLWQVIGLIVYSWWILFQLVIFGNFKKYFNIFIIKMYYLIVLISSVINILILMLSFSCCSSLIQICKNLPIYQSFSKNLLLVIFIKPFSLLFSTPLFFIFISTFNCFYFLILKNRWIPLFSVPLNLKLIYTFYLFFLF